MEKYADIINVIIGTGFMSESLSNNYFNQTAFGGGYDPAKRYQDAEQNATIRETQVVQEQVKKEQANPFGSLTLGPHTANLVKGIVGEMAFGAWDEFDKWLKDNEAIFTGEAGAEMRSIFIHGFNTGAAMRADDEERNGKTTFTLVS